MDKTIKRPPKMRYCKKCVYPSSSAVPLAFDENGICSWCKASNQKVDINWGKRLELLKKELTVAKISGLTSDKLVVLATTLYEKTYSALDIVDLLEKTSLGLSNDNRYKLLFIFEKIKLDFRSDKLLLLFMLNFVFIDNNQTNLEQLINI